MSTILTFLAKGNFCADRVDKNLQGHGRHDEKSVSTNVLKFNLIQIFEGRYCEVILAF